jgi:hypothetical protein
MTQLGKLEKVDVRKVWEHEARDFSAWLARPENLEMLGEQIGIEIEPLGTEVEMGSFRIDILGREPNTDERVIIENQLEQTNHDHLGKVVTYAAGLDARYLIWVVKDVRDEHLKAIEWLNEHLDDSIRCFLIKIEVWQIGDSQPAPRFDVISMKNDWVATVKKTAAATEVSSLKLRQQEFWEKLAAYIRAKDSTVKIQTPRPQHWLDFSMGNSICHLALKINAQKNIFGVQVYITSDKDLWEHFKNNADVINSIAGHEVFWWESSKASGGGIKLHVPDVFDESREVEYFEWLYVTLINLKRALVPHVQDYRSLEN